MRKHNEGYVLVLVLVVLIVLCLFSTAILTGAQRNLQAQMSSLAYMEDKYRAQGEIEKFVTKLEALAEAEPLYADLASVLPDAEDTLKVEIDDINKQLLVTTSSGGVCISCTLTLDCTYIDVSQSSEGKYYVGAFKGVACTSCEISRVEVSDND